MGDRVGNVEGTSGDDIFNSSILYVVQVSDIIKPLNRLRMIPYVFLPDSWRISYLNPWTTQ